MSDMRLNDERVSVLLTEDAVWRRWYLTVPEVAAHTELWPELVRKAIYCDELQAVRDDLGMMQQLGVIPARAP